MLSGLTDDEIAGLAALGAVRRYAAGHRIVAAEEPASSLFFLQSGMVSVKLPSGVRLASLDQGMEFGEMALLEERRSADVWPPPPGKARDCPSTKFIKSPWKNPLPPSATPAKSPASSPNR